MSDEVFQWPIRVYIEDTDAGGIVFHAKYLHYMERARTEWVRSQGVALREGLSDNISYVVQKMNIHYAAPGFLDDELVATAELTGRGRVWMGFRQRVVRERDSQVLAEADVRVACVALDSGRPRPLPETMKAVVDAASRNTESHESARSTG
ncbi:acyl-CoA thioester hydrolase [Tamilnaduibacter salinus]|uniref:4-hydroxybenzoyl-CoA thioesterase n=1 Tax=Tamilnaduibacter salinus TaxID=1484056 RepID=A0A2A2I4M1_9GAMM|nr:YbgC/FadM family acyl-CoA thioesterase [Tamilnaduibacter salinus]PAV26951.1 4-hydroxybenzoyl-CoA thioesterase [Tamilnaduibacter salinus]PVY78356.1 acyl-CoA thioester hydrolase [Tamilnaduibacter salinus]